MKKLAYFLVLFVGINVYATTDRVGTGGGGGRGSPSSGGSANVLGEAYLQMMHWRVFVVTYMGMCDRSRSAEVGAYVDSIRNDMLKRGAEAAAAETILKNHGERIRPYGYSTETQDFPGYGSGSTDICATKLANTYQAGFGGGTASFCSTNRARFDEILSTKGLNNIKAKAKEVALANPNLFASGVCLPQSGSITIGSSATGNNGGSLASASTGGGGAPREETMSAQATQTDRPTANVASAPQRTVGNPGAVDQGRTADAESAPQGGAPAAPAVTVAATPPPTAPAPGTPKPNPTAAAKPATPAGNPNKETATGGGGGGGAPAVASTGQGVAPESPIVKTAAVAPAGKPEAASGSPSAKKAAAKEKVKKITPVTYSLSNKENEDYKKLFISSPACINSEKAGSKEDIRHKVAQMDALIHVYKGACVKSEDKVRNKWYEDYVNYTAKISNNQIDTKDPKFQTHRKHEKDLSSENKDSEYCQGTRKAFFKSFTEYPSDTKMSTFANNVMCK